MSFGIEFDIDDVDMDGDVQGVPPAPGTSDARMPPVPPGTTGQVVSEPAGDSGMGEVPGHRFDRLFDLTRSLREQDRERWLRRYAEMRVDDGVPGRVAGIRAEGNPSGLARDGHASRQVEGCDDAPARTGDEEVGDVLGDGSLGDGHAGDSRQGGMGMPDDGAQGDAHGVGAGGEGDMPACTECVERTGDATGIDDGGIGEESQGMSEGMGALGALSLLAVVLSVLSVACAFVPVMGRVLWVPFAVVAVMAAVPTLVRAYLRNKPIALPVVAILVAMLAMVASSVADGAYVATGVIATGEGEPGVTVPADGSAGLRGQGEGAS